MEIAAPYLVDLSKKHETRVDLTVLDGTDIVYLSRVPSRDELLNLAPLGRRWPAVNTASGRAILATLSDEDLGHILSSSTYTKHTPYTLTNRNQIVETIKKARSDGYAFQSEEVLQGAASVGAAVIDGEKHVHGAIIIGGPAAAFEDSDKKHAFGMSAIQTAQAIGTYNLA